MAHHAEYVMAYHAEYVILFPPLGPLLLFFTKINGKLFTKYARG